MGEYPGRDFTEVPEGSTSAAPSPPRAPKRQRIMDVLDDSKDFDDTHFTSGDDGNSAIPASPLIYRPPPRTEKKILRNLGSTRCKLSLLNSYILWSRFELTVWF
jgi:hypothetical protein